MKNQARLTAYYPRNLSIHQVREEKQIQRNKLVLKVVQTRRKPSHNLNPLTKLRLQLRRRTNSLRTYLWFSEHDLSQLSHH